MAAIPCGAFCTRFRPYPWRRHALKPARIEYPRFCTTTPGPRVSKLTCNGQLSSDRRETESVGNRGSVNGTFAPNANKIGSSNSIGVTDPDGEFNVVGEDAAVFDVRSQKLSSWIYFTVILGVVTLVLYFAWIDPSTGYGGAFVDAVSSLSTNHEAKSCP